MGWIMRSVVNACWGAVASAQQAAAKDWAGF